MAKWIYVRTSVTSHKITEMVFYVFLSCTSVECEADNQNKHMSPSTEINDG